MFSSCPCAFKKCQVGQMTLQCIWLHSEIYERQISQRYCKKKKKKFNVFDTNCEFVCRLVEQLGHILVQSLSGSIVRQFWKFKVRDLQIITCKYLNYFVSICLIWLSEQRSSHTGPQQDSPLKN